MRGVTRKIIVRSGCWLALLVGCGARTNLDGDEPGSSGAGGTAGALHRTGASGAPSTGGSNGGRAGSSAGGTLGGGTAGAGSSGAATGGATSGGVATAGASSAGASSAGSAASAACTDPGCVCLSPQLLSVTPPNAQTNVFGTSRAKATFSCPPDAKISRPEAMSVTGHFAGALPTSFPPPAAANEVSLQASAPDTVRTNPYFPGEILTARLSHSLGGPYLWQFTAAVRAKTSAKFSDTGQTLSPAMEAELADLDADGDLDLVTGSSSDSVGRVYSNDGQGNFTLRASLNGIRKPFLVDLDLDGQLDVVSDHVFLGAGPFSYLEAPEFGEVHAVFDADADGDFDVFQVQDQQQWVLLRNDGAGQFAPTLMDKAYVFDVQVGDLDNDGDLDLVVLALASGTPDAYRGAVLLNDGTGHFSEIQAGLMVNATRAIALGDVDGDGDLDVFMASWGAAGAYNPADRVWLNDGSAHFTAGDAPLEGSIHVVLSDLDGDGDLDAIAGQHAPYSTAKGTPSQVLLNDGKGRFSSSGSVGGSNFQRVVLGDLDGDGDLDAVVAQWDWYTKPPVEIWRQDG